MKRNRFVQLTGGTRSVNRDLEAKAKALAGLKGHITNLDAPTAAFVIGAYHQLWQVEKSFRISKSDLRARPVFHHKATRSKPTSPWCSLLSPSPAGSKTTGWSIKKLVTILRRYHTVQIKVADQTVTAAVPYATTRSKPS